MPRNSKAVADVLKAKMDNQEDLAGKLLAKGKKVLPLNNALKKMKAVSCTNNAPNSDLKCIIKYLDDYQPLFLDCLN